MGRNQENRVGLISAEPVRPEEVPPAIWKEFVRLGETLKGPALAVLARETGEILAVNDRVVAVTGFAREQIIKHPLPIPFPEDSEWTGTERMVTWRLNTGTEEGSNDFAAQMAVSEVVAEGKRFWMANGVEVTEICKQALVDELTGLFNLRGLLTIGRQRLASAERLGVRMVLAFADFDGLKQINDRFGHPEGDKSLMAVAAVLRETCRLADVKARHGGDEFAILAETGGEGGGETLMTRLAENLEKKNEERRNKRCPPVGLSVGLAYFDPEAPCSIEELLRRADIEMYIRKQAKGAEKK